MTWVYTHTGFGSRSITHIGGRSACIADFAGAGPRPDGVSAVRVSMAVVPTLGIVW